MERSTPSSAGNGTNGIPLWTEWHFGKHTITTGLKRDVGIGLPPKEYIDTQIVFYADSSILR
ncbi:hypothetical protein COOONC_09533 [Cooperia oncophora]